MSNQVSATTTSTRVFSHRNTSNRLIWQAMTTGIVLSWMSVSPMSPEAQLRSSKPYSQALAKLAVQVSHHLNPLPGAYAHNSGGPAWVYVEQAATWARANSTLGEALLAPIKASGILNRTAAATGTITDVNGGGWKWRITANSPVSINVTALGGAATSFNNELEIWQEASGNKALEMFFNDSSAPGTAGILLIYSQNRLNLVRFANGQEMTESYTWGTAPNRKQVYSWSGVLNSNATILVPAGRVILEEMDSGQTFCFKAVAKLQGSPLCGASGNDYYAIAYSQKQTGNNEVVAKFSLNRNSVAHNGNICGLPNSYNYGLFDSTGFISDHNASSAIGSNYPSYARVDANLNRAQGTSGVWDDIEAATIDALNIQFNSSSNASF